MNFVVLAAVGGSAGCLLRVLVRDALAAAGVKNWQAIALVNLAGSAVAGWIVAGGVGADGQALLLVGFLGGFTSFSSMAVDMVALWVSRRRGACALLGCATLLLSPAAAMAAAAAHGTAVAAAITAPAAAPAARRRWIALDWIGVAAVVAGGMAGCAARAGAFLATAAQSLPAPVATTVCNVLGSAAAAITCRVLVASTPDALPVAHPTVRRHVDRLVLLGFCGGLTSVSTLAVEMAELAHTNPLHCALLGAANLVLGVGAAAGGWWLVRCRHPHRERLEHESKGIQAASADGGRR